MTVQQRISDYFDKNVNAMVDDISRLIRIDSTRGEAAEGMPFGPGPAAALQKALAIAEGMGFRVQDDDHFVGTVDLNEGPKHLEILAHLDVVPAGDGWQMTRPFEPRVIGGRLYGRGAADDKGPAVAALYAMRAVRELGLPVTQNARLLFGTDEESGFRDLAHYYAHEPEADMSFSPDADFPLVNVEKGHFSNPFGARWREEDTHPRMLSVRGGIRGNVIPRQAVAVVDGLSAEEIKPYAERAGEKTGVHFTCRAGVEGTVINAEGVSAHASTPQKGNNPITALLELLTELPLAETEGMRKLRAVHHMFPHGDWLGRACGAAMHDELSGDLTISLNTFAYSPSELTGSFDCRTPLCATRENLADGMEKRMAAAGIPLTACRMLPGHHVPEDSSFVRTLLTCYETFTGRKGSCRSFGGGTYAHNLKNGVAFGCVMPGVNCRKHGSDERAVVEDLKTSGKIFALAIATLCR